MIETTSKKKDKDMKSTGIFGRMAFGLVLVISTLGGEAFAGVAVSAPEIDAGSMTAAVALLSGAVLVVTNRVRRK